MFKLRMWSSSSDHNTSAESLDVDSSASSIMSTGSICGSKKRKSFPPRRAAVQDDPNFRGVTICMENEYVNQQWRLKIKAKYSLSPKKKKFSTYVESSDEDDSSSVGYSYEEKHCASCSAVKTPLWRDAEDGTPLCNACGIRYKKYKLRCANCWHIPKKDEFSPKCCSCGYFYEYVSPRR